MSTESVPQFEPFDACYALSHACVPELFCEEGYSITQIGP
jgi:hypothetical protein